MSLGNDYGQNSDGFYITQPADQFGNADQFAFVVILERPFGTTKVNLVLVQIGSGGVESVKLSVPASISDPSFNEIANRFPTSTLMSGNPPGQYKFEIQTDTEILAQAGFTYLG